MNKYEIRTQAKKAALVRAALALFREKGYTGVSVNEIAVASGVSALSIYNYFGSKEKLLHECARVLLLDMNKSIIELLEEKSNFTERLVKAVSLCAEQPHQLADEGFSKAALDDKVFIGLLNESAQQIKMEVLTTFIESGRQEGLINAVIPTETIVAFLEAVTEIEATWKVSSECREKIESLHHLMLYGLIGRE